MGQELKTQGNTVYKAGLTEQARAKWQKAMKMLGNMFDIETPEQARLWPHPEPGLRFGMVVCSDWSSGWCSTPPLMGLQDVSHCFQGFCPAEGARDCEDNPGSCCSGTLAGSVGLSRPQGLACLSAVCKREGP